ncbi:MAG: ABC transporter ATP-binding protein [Chloroflexota bacterium]|nr:MAG: ABC transporter ATP-binding protein [Chloroflexota bacterium]
MTDNTPILKVEDLTVAYRYGGAWLDAVRGVSLQIEPSQTYGLVGESGSGKTTLANAIMGYLGQNGRVREGKIEFNGRDLSSMNQEQMRALWGTEICLVPQNPLSSLNPSLRVGEQVAEIICHHQGLSRSAAWASTISLFSLVRLPDPERVAESYPHQISGGMQQRVLIAMALSTSPRLLVLDEPTTNLDVTTQASILDLFRDLIKGKQTAVLYITHNLGVIAQICDRVAVLYAGELVEDASLTNLFAQPLHPYTQGLLDSVPRLGHNKCKKLLHAIPGQIPALGARPTGCVFEPRCDFAIDQCLERPPLSTPDGKRFIRCHRYQMMGQSQIGVSRSSRQDIPAYENQPPYRDKPEGLPVLSSKNLAVHFDLPRSIGDLVLRQPARKVRAVDGISLEVSKGRTLGLVGESGSGKSSLARAVVGLIEIRGGEIGLLGVPLPAKLSRRDLETLRHIQMVFQNPEEAFNPYLTIGASLRRPLMVLLGKSKGEADTEAARLLAAVRLPAEVLERMPGQLSGGEKQRVAIARAFASHPDLLICDEPVSSLDVSVQASILNLLNQLQVENQNAMLFISHDLAVVSYLADEIAVIYLGHLMEVARADDLFQPPYHPYTEALLSAIPQIQPGVMPEMIRLEGDVPSPTQKYAGCPFYMRCPRVIASVCSDQPPPWRIDEQTGMKICCHIELEELRSIQKKLLSI